MKTEKEKSWDNLEDNAQLTFSLKGLKVLLRGAVNEGKQKAIKQMQEVIEKMNFSLILLYGNPKELKMEIKSRIGKLVK